MATKKELQKRISELEDELKQEHEYSKENEDAAKAFNELMDEFGDFITIMWEYDKAGAGEEHLFLKHSKNFLNDMWAKFHEKYVESGKVYSE